MKLTLQQLEAHLWGAVNILRGKRPEIYSPRAICGQSGLYRGPSWTV